MEAPVAFVTLESGLPFLMLIFYVQFKAGFDFKKFDYMNTVEVTLV